MWKKIDILNVIFFILVFFVFGVSLCFLIFPIKQIEFDWCSFKGTHLTLKTQAKLKELGYTGSFLLQEQSCEIISFADCSYNKFCF